MHATSTPPLLTLAHVEGRLASLGPRCRHSARRMPSTAVRSPRSSQPSTSMTTQRTPEPATPATVRTAPYLTHIVTHHGQLTLIPPQNAGRIRSPKTKKKRQPDSAAREEPRFTTAVPPSASRRIHPQSAPNARVRRQAASQPARPPGDPVLDSESCFVLSRT